MKIVNKHTSTFDRVTSSGRKQVNDFLYRHICFVISGFEFAVGTVCGVGLMMETAVGERTADAVMEEGEQKGDLRALGGGPISVAGAISLEKPVAFQLAQIIAELVQTIGVRRNRKRFT